MFLCKINPVHHRNHNTLCNRVTNLQWCSRDFNIRMSVGRPIREDDAHGQLQQDELNAVEIGDEMDELNVEARFQQHQSHNRQLNVPGIN